MGTLAAVASSGVFVSPKYLLCSLPGGTALWQGDTSCPQGYGEQITHSDTRFWWLRLQRRSRSSKVGMFELPLSRYRWGMYGLQVQSTLYVAGPLAFRSPDYEQKAL